MTTPAPRITSADDLLALVPCVLGFHPQDSLVLVSVAAGGDNLHARVDLSPDEAERAAALGGLLTAVDRVGARRVALVAYSDDAVLAEDAVEEVTDALVARRVTVITAIRADGRRWYSLDCDSDCCPPAGHAYDLTAHPITAQFVLDGQVTFGSRGELADSLVGTDIDDMDEVALAADAAMGRLRVARASRPEHDPGDGRHPLAIEGLWVRARVRRFLADRCAPDAEDAGRIAAAVSSIEVRDVAWSEMTRSTAHLHVELWRGLVRRLPAELLAAPAALLGFAAWLAGDGALAWCAVERCQEVEPDYSMAALLAQALAAAIPPSTWRPIPVDALPLFAT